MKELEPLINQVVDIVKGSKDFVLSQAPDFLREFIVYSYLQAIGWIVLSVVGLSLAVKAGLYLRNRKMDDVEVFFSCMGLSVVALASITGIISNVIELLCIWLIPKVYIVMHLARCLKTGG